METEALLVILIFTLLCTTLLFAYMFSSVSKEFKLTMEEAKTLIQIITALYEQERDKNQRQD